MSGYLVVYSPRAKDDLRKIYSYIAFTLKVPGTAERQVNRIRDAIRSLDSLPFRNPSVDWEPWKSMGMHKVGVGRFVVFYVVDEATAKVTIIRIVYGGRDIENLAISETES